MNEIKNIYYILLKRFGKQGWWPLSVNGIPAHNGKRPSSERDKFEICAGAILTQNTNWKNVEKAIVNLNMENLLDIKKINKINKKRLANLIKSSGYYNQKASKLKIFADYVIKNYNGKLGLFFKKKINELRDELLSIKGIGPETADSIILYAAEKPVFVIDAYTKRIFLRLGICKKDVKYDELQKIFHKNLPLDVSLFKEYHALIVELGKNFCKSKARCELCFLGCKSCKS